MTSAHAFCKNQAKLNIRRLRRTVAREKGAGLLQSLCVVYQRVSIAVDIVFCAKEPAAAPLASSSAAVSRKAHFSFHCANPACNPRSALAVETASEASRGTSKEGRKLRKGTKGGSFRQDILSLRHDVLLTDP